MRTKEVKMEGFIRLLELKGEDVAAVQRVLHGDVAEWGVEAVEYHYWLTSLKIMWKKPVIHSQFDQA